MFTVVDDGSLPSLAELVERDVGASPSDAAIGTLRRTLDEEDLPVTATPQNGHASWLTTDSPRHWTTSSSTDSRPRMS